MRPGRKSPTEPDGRSPHYQLRVLCRSLYRHGNHSAAARSNAHSRVFQLPFSKFRKPDGSLYDSTSTTTVLRDSTVTMLTTPIVTSKARAAYNCNTLVGFELENYGSTGTASSHWEKRIILNDFMMSTLTMDAVYSDVSLAVLEDSGWYKVDYSYTDPIVFGRDKNCDFFTRKCVAGGIAQFSDFCVTPSNNECVLRICAKRRVMWEIGLLHRPHIINISVIHSLRAWTPLQISVLLDPFGNGDCKNRGSIATFYQPVLFGEQLCDTCMCFTGTYILQYRVIANPLHSGCHSVVCDNGVAKVTKSLVQWKAAKSQTSPGTPDTSTAHHMNAYAETALALMAALGTESASGEVASAMMAIRSSTVR